MIPIELFERVRALWPDAIVLKGPANEGDTNLQWSLIHTYEGIEREVVDDEWLALGAWAFHQALSEIAATRLSAGYQFVETGSVTLASFDECMRDNLADDSWVIERQQYGQMTD